MNARLPRTLTYAVVISIFLNAFIAASGMAAEPEAFYLFRDQTHASGNHLVDHENVLGFDEKGDLLIQLGNTRITVAYNAPKELFRPSEQQYNPQCGSPAIINGISLTASISF